MDIDTALAGAGAALTAFGLAAAIWPKRHVRDGLPPAKVRRVGLVFSAIGSAMLAYAL